MSAFHDSEIYRSILESLPTGLASSTCRRKSCSGATGRSASPGTRHEVIGHSCIAETLLHCDQPGCEFCNEECPLARAIKTSHPRRSHRLPAPQGGHEVPVRIRAVPVRNAHGSIIGAVETFEDLQQGRQPDRREDGLQVPGCVDESRELPATP